MADYEFAYTETKLAPSKVCTAGKSIYRPVLQVHLKTSAGGSFSCLGVADSGADHCIFPLSFLAPLGLDPLKLVMEMTAGVGSIANATYYSEISISFNTTSGQVLSFTTLAGFTAGLDAIGMGLLGQEGFFETFHTTFNHKTRIFTIHA